MKVCMIGCGGFASLCHGPAQRRCARESPEVELAGCCDTDADRAREYGKAFGYLPFQRTLAAMVVPHPAVSWDLAAKEATLSQLGSYDDPGC
jgi:predicted dehydrogenase